ncbi:hypothetical protein ACQ4LE_005075 [Meloidogyne hapla]
MPSKFAENPQMNIQGEQPFDPWSRIYVPWMAEFTGTMLFVLFSNLLGTLLIGDNSTSTSIYEGIILLSLLISFGQICLCHFNPALTITSILCLGTPLLLGLSLLFAQFFGGFIGGLLFRSIISKSTFLDIFTHFSVLNSINQGDIYQIIRKENEENVSNVSDQFSNSPFGGRLQVFLLETFCSSVLILSQLFPSHFGHSINEIALSTGSARSFTSSLTLISPLGQSGNLARTLANNLIATIFIRAEDFSIWRYFHLHLFAEICSAIVVAAIFWLFKYAKNVNDRNTVELNANIIERER